MGFKHLKKPLKSTITTIDWHPNGVLLACGSTDGHVRVFSGYIKGIDAKPDPSVWGTKLPFQTFVVIIPMKPMLGSMGLNLVQMVMRWLMFLMILQ